MSGALREQLLTALALGPGRASAPTPAEAVTLAAQGAASVEPYVARFLPALVTAAVVPALAVVTLAFVDWLSALVVVLTLPLLPLFAALIGATTRDATERRWGALADLSGHFLDVVRGLPTLVATAGASARCRPSPTSASGTGGRRWRPCGWPSSARRRSSCSPPSAWRSSRSPSGCGWRTGRSTSAPGCSRSCSHPRPTGRSAGSGAEFHSAADGAAALASALPQLDARPRTSAVRARTARRTAVARWPRARLHLPGVERAGAGRLDLMRGDRAHRRHRTVGLRQVDPARAGRRAAHAHRRATVTRRVDPPGDPAPVPHRRQPAREPHARAPARSRRRPSGRPCATSGSTGWSPPSPTACRPGSATTAAASRPGSGPGWCSPGRRSRDADVILLDEPTAHLDDESAAVAHRVILDLAGTAASSPSPTAPSCSPSADHQRRSRRPATTQAGAGMRSLSPRIRRPPAPSAPPRSGPASR